MTRIVFFTDAFWPHVGGVDVLAADLGAALIDRGYEIVIATSRTDEASPDSAVYRGLTIHRFPFVPAILHRDVEAMAESMARLGRLYSELQSDLYHVMPSGPACLFHLRAASRHPAPTLASIQLPMPDRREEHLLTGRLLRSADWVTACSQRILNGTRALAPEITPRSSLVYNGLPDPTREVVPQELGRPLLLCLGRLVSDKGFDIALRALPAIVGRFPRARMVIAGDGSAKDDLERMADDLGVSRSVAFVGEVDRADVPSLIDSSTMVLMPSRWEEAFGLVALEAAQRGRPVVATRVGGLPEVVANGETGLLVPSDDPAALGSAVTDLLGDPDRAKQMGLKARDRAALVFGWDRYVRAHEALYERLLDADHPLVRA